jgi:hypothetical protein
MTDPEGILSLIGRFQLVGVLFLRRTATADTRTSPQITAESRASTQ